MSYSRDKRIQLLRLGLCTKCQRPMTQEEIADNYTTCANCRRLARELYAEKKQLAEQKAEREAEEEEKKSKYAKCETCPYCTYTGSRIWYCPFFYCIKEPRPDAEGGENNVLAGDTPSY